jgi:CMP/dCMP kinase
VTSGILSNMTHSTKNNSLAICPVITIDGPTASGKGTIAQRVANHLGWHYLDSGALYRLVGFSANQKGLFAAGFPEIGSSNESALAQCATQLDVRFENANIWLEGVDVSLAIRHEQVGLWASQVGAVPSVRAALAERQRQFRQPPGLVADGRDMGTVIFPDAQLKIFLTASAESRAQRRYKQLIDKGISANLMGLLEDLRARDARDINRATAPLKPASDAVLIDSTALDVEETVAAVLFNFAKVSFESN